MIFAIIGVAIVIFIVAFAFFLLRISIYKDTVGRSEENFRKFLRQSNQRLFLGLMFYVPTGKSTTIISLTPRESVYMPI